MAISFHLQTTSHAFSIFYVPTDVGVATLPPVSSLVAMFLTLCGSSRPKRRQMPSSGSNGADDESNVGEATPGYAEDAVKAPSAIPIASAKFSSDIGSNTERTVIGGAATHGPIAASFPTRSPKSRLSMSMSMKLPRKLAKILTSRRREVERSAEDSVWMKAISLGERCKVPSDDDDDEVAFYDDDGNRRLNYRPRTPRSLPATPNASCMR